MGREAKRSAEKLLRGVAESRKAWAAMGAGVCPEDSRVEESEPEVPENRVASTRRVFDVVEAAAAAVDAVEGFLDWAMKLEMSRSLREVGVGSFMPARPTVSLLGDTPHCMICMAAPGKSAVISATAAVESDTDTGGCDSTREEDRFPAM